MMSQPDQIHVDHPGATGAGPLLANSNSTSGSSVATASDDALSGPWTIGSTEGASMYTPPAPISAGSLIDQAGVRHATPSPPPQFRGGGVAIGAGGEATSLQTITTAQHKSLYQDRLFQQPSSPVEAVFSASCETMGFDIAEMWLRTGPKTHQLTNSHLRPTSLEDSVRAELVDVYYGERSSVRTHRLSPALCKRAKEANDVVWVTALTPHGAEALRISISDVRTAVAIPVCHAASNTNLTVIFFSVRRIIMKPQSVEFLVHMSLAAAVASVNSLAVDGHVDTARVVPQLAQPIPVNLSRSVRTTMSHSEHTPQSQSMVQPMQYNQQLSVTGGRLDMQWKQLRHVEYLTDGGNSWIHTAILDGRPVVVKTLKPECQDVALAINEIESELSVHARLSHPNIVNLIGAGLTSRGVRFIVLERLDGGTLTQMLGYDTRIRDRRRRFWRKKPFSYADVLNCAMCIANAMAYCQEEAIPDCMVLHRDLKPDNIGFTLSGTVKVLDFGLAKIVEHASAKSNESYAMSGETGSLRYMAPEVADSLPYNHKADVYSFGIILWELNSLKKPFEGLDRDQFYSRVVHGGERPIPNKKWPEELVTLMTECWSPNPESRPSFSEISRRLASMLSAENEGSAKKKQSSIRKFSGIIDRHSTWF